MNLKKTKSFKPNEHLLKIEYEIFWQKKKLDISKNIIWSKRTSTPRRVAMENERNVREKKNKNNNQQQQTHSHRKTMEKRAKNKSTQSIQFDL